MSENYLELKLCPKCGSTNYMKNYPSPDTSLCLGCGGTSIETVKLTVTQEDNLFDDSLCPFCNQKDDDQEVILDESETGDTTVLKCNNCGKLYGFKILSATGLDDENIDDGDFGSEACEFAKDEGTFIYSSSAAEKFAKVLKEREKDPLAKCLKSLRQLIKEKSHRMLEMGMTSLTIDIATWRAKKYLTHKGPITNNQLEHLFSAAIALTQEELASRGELKGKRLTERQMAEIFSARNTTRKWKALLQKKSGQ
jgi:hypothetical protein